MNVFKILNVIYYLPKARNLLMLLLLVLQSNLLRFITLTLRRFSEKYFHPAQLRMILACTIIEVICNRVVLPSPPRPDK